MHVQSPACGRISAHITGECASPCRDDVASRTPTDGLLLSIKNWHWIRKEEQVTVLQEGALVTNTEGNSSHLKMRLLQQGGFGVGFEVGPLVSWGSISVEL